jgi:hypothetical protein
VTGRDPDFDRAGTATPGWLESESLGW